MSTKTTLFYRDNVRGHILFASKGAKQRFVGCERKSKLTSIAANAIVKTEREKGNPLKIYLCPQCSMWHLTHKI